MLADIVDVMPAVRAADKLVLACREKAARDGLDMGDAGALREWAIERANVRDPLVERAMTALFRRDAAWGAANLEQDPFWRYTSELGAEMAGEPREMRDLWTASLGSFDSCGASFEVALHRPSELCPGPAHLHVRMERHPRVPDVCVGLFDAVYLPFGHRRWELDRRHREDLADFLESLVFPGEAWPVWYEAEHWWERTCEEDGIETEGHLDFEDMPDYRRLRWIEDEGAPA